MTSPRGLRCVAPIDVARRTDDCPETLASEWVPCDRVAVHRCEECGGAFCSTHVGMHEHRSEMGPAGAEVRPMTAARRRAGALGWSVAP